MAKKEDLMSGFVRRIEEGTPTPSKVVESAKPAFRSGERKELTPQQKKRMRDGKKNVSTGGMPARSNYLYTSLALDADLYEKIRQIADANGLIYRDVINAALELYIERYEAKNGPVETLQESKISAKSLI